jgi:hypothetical protein
MTRKSGSRLTRPAIAAFAVLAILIALAIASRFPPETPSSTRGDQSAQIPSAENTKPMHSEVQPLLNERRKLDDTVWAQEVAAQEYEQTIVKYWDQMLQPEDDKYAVLARIPFQSITFDPPGATTNLEWDI